MSEKRKCGVLLPVSSLPRALFEHRRCEFARLAVNQRPNRIRKPALSGNLLFRTMIKRPHATIIFSQPSVLNQSPFSHAGPYII